MQYAGGMDAVVFWVALGVVITAYMSLWYGTARYFNRYDVVDTAWGLGFIVFAWTALGIRAQFGTAQIVSAVLVSIWGLRLSAHLARRSMKRGSDDHRYQELRQKWGSASYKTYTHIFLFQGLLILLVSLPIAAIAFSTRGANALTYSGWVLWLFGIVFEATADRQLDTFLAKRPKDSHAIMQTGLWRLSRHPNYFGEVTTWWGAAIVALSLNEWWGVFGALLITLLITKVSGIPPLEKHYEGNSTYEAYRRRTSLLIPWKPKASA